MRSLLVGVVFAAAGLTAAGAQSTAAGAQSTAAGAQSTAAGAQGADAVVKSPVYDVIAVKVNKSGENNMRMGGPPGKYSATNTYLWLLIANAYDLQTEEMLSGLPGWADSTRFDIEARMDPDTVEAFKKLPTEERMQQNRLRLQALLADRFGLKVHHVTRDLPAYAMVVAKGGFKLKDADLDHPTVDGSKGPGGSMKPGMMMFGNGTLTAQAIPLTSLARNLSSNLHRQVVDKTGLTGEYDMTLKWTPDDQQGGGPAADGSAAPLGPSLMTALEEQLGLKLVSMKLPTDTIVVDHVQMPSEN